MIKIIAAIGLDRSMGLRGKKSKLPWKKGEFKGDLERFRNETNEQVVIMGRRTWDSLGRKVLPNRVSCVVSKSLSKTNIPGFFGDLESAIDWAQKNHSDRDIYIIGGENLFRDGQRFAQEIDLTILPYKGYEHYDVSSLIYFPSVSKNFKKYRSFTHPNNPELRILKYEL